MLAQVAGGDPQGREVGVGPVHPSVQQLALGAPLAQGQADGDGRGAGVLGDDLQMAAVQMLSLTHHHLGGLRIG